MVTLAIVRWNKSPSCGKIGTGGWPGLGTIGSDRCCKYQVPARQAATQSVAVSAPHFVLRFQKSAAIITGDMAAKPENANRTANSKILSGVISATMYARAVTTTINARAK